MDIWFKKSLCQLNVKRLLPQNYEFITTLSPQVIFLFSHSWSSMLVLHIPE